VFLGKFARAWSWGILFSSKAQTSLRGEQYGNQNGGQQLPADTAISVKVGIHH
jgi:hypothetical protein